MGGFLMYTISLDCIFGIILNFSLIKDSSFAHRYQNNYLNKQNKTDN